MNVSMMYVFLCGITRGLLLVPLSLSDERVASESGHIVACLRHGNEGEHEWCDVDRSGNKSFEASGETLGSIETLQGLHSATNEAILLFANNQNSGDLERMGQ